METRKRALGKGLEQLFNNENLNLSKFEEQVYETASKEEIIEVDLSELRVNPYQPRKVFNDDALRELASSIKEHGVFQPIIVKKSIKGYEIIAGERRVRASKLAGLTKVPAIIRDLNDEQMMEIALLENLQRENLSAIEEAIAYKSMLEKLNLTQDELSKKVQCNSNSYEWFKLFASKAIPITASQSDIPCSELCHGFGICDYLCLNLYRVQLRIIAAHVGCVVAVSVLLLSEWYLYPERVFRTYIFRTCTRIGCFWYMFRRKQEYFTLWQCRVIGGFGLNTDRHGYRSRWSRITRSGINRFVCLNLNLWYGIDFRCSLPANPGTSEEQQNGYYYTDYDVDFLLHARYLTIRSTLAIMAFMVVA